MALVVVPLSLLGIAAGSWWLPLWAAALAYPAFFSYLKQGDWSGGMRAMGTWALSLAVWVTAATVIFPDRMASAVLHGVGYREEMFGWIAAGTGAEGDWRLFVPQHLLHAAGFVLACSISVGFLGLVMGVILMNYMAFYVGSLLLEAESPARALLLGWPPWAAFRVVAFLLLSFPASAWIWRRNLHLVFPERRILRFLAWALILLVSDVVLKYGLAAVWREWLKSATGL